MRKTINGKSYSTTSDSEMVASYLSVIDGWCRTRYYVYRKKSTGEYFEYTKPNSWGEGEDIELLSDDKGEEIIKMVRAGNEYYYTAYMSSAKTLKTAYVMWGTEEDNPWNKKAGRKRAEERKKEKEEQEKQAAEVKDAVKSDKQWGASHWGVLEVTGCSEGYEFNKFDGKPLPDERVGKVVFHKINMRIVNNDFKENEGSKGWYKYHTNLVMPVGSDKKDVKKTLFDLMDEVKKEYGELDAVMKDGVFLAPPKNRTMIGELQRKVGSWNESMCF